MITQIVKTKDLKEDIFINVTKEGFSLEDCEKLLA